MVSQLPVHIQKSSGLIRVVRFRRIHFNLISASVNKFHVTIVRARVDYGSTSKQLDVAGAEFVLKKLTVQLRRIIEDGCSQPFYFSALHEGDECTINVRFLRTGDVKDNGGTVSMQSYMFV